MEQMKLEITLVLLRHKQLHVRGIAKTLNQPHANVSRTMKRLLSANVVDFIILGKNKVFRLKKGLEATTYIYLAENFKLLKLIAKYPFLSVIAESILSSSTAPIILIFGSFSKFTAKQDSDIDLYVQTTSRKTKSAIEAINSRLSVKIGMLDKNNLLSKEIIKDHVVLRGAERYYEQIKFFD